MKPINKQPMKTPADAAAERAPLAAISGLTPCKRLLAVIAAALVALAVLCSLGCGNEEEAQQSSLNVAEFLKDYGAYGSDYLPDELDLYSGDNQSDEYEAAKEAQQRGVLSSYRETSTLGLQITGPTATGINRSEYLSKLNNQGFDIVKALSSGDASTNYENLFLNNSRLNKNIRIIREKYVGYDSWVIYIW